MNWTAIIILAGIILWDVIRDWYVLPRLIERRLHREKKKCKNFKPEGMGM